MDQAPYRAEGEREDSGGVPLEWTKLHIGREGGQWEGGQWRSTTRVDQKKESGGWEEREGGGDRVVTYMSNPSTSGDEMILQSPKCVCSS